MMSCAARKLPWKRAGLATANWTPSLSASRTYWSDSSKVRAGGASFSTWNFFLRAAFSCSSQVCISAAYQQAIELILHDELPEVTVGVTMVFRRGFLGFLRVQIGHGFDLKTAGSTAALSRR